MAGPVDEEERFLVRIAWACEIEGITQAAAAERFGVTRLRVNKALAEARRRGIVRVSINSAFGPCVEAEQQLKARYGLSDVHVAPTPADAGAVQATVGAALGHYLTTCLANPDVRLFGMAWGNTLNIATRFMTPLDRPDLEIVSVMGGVTRGSDLNSYEIARRLASLCNAGHSYLTAPIYAGSGESRDVLMQQDVFASVIDRIRAADAVALAVGGMEQSLLLKDALPSGVTVQELKRAGAVGDILGYFLDRDGTSIDHPVNGLQVGIGLADLDTIPNVILAGGGPHKTKIIRAVMQLGCVDALITDEQTARALL